MLLSDIPSPLSLSHTIMIQPDYSFIPSVFLSDFSPAQRDRKKTERKMPDYNKNLLTRLFVPFCGRRLRFVAFPALLLTVSAYP